MLVAVDENNRYVNALHADPHKEYRCPVCFKPVILKNGRHKIAHFSHKRVTDCHKVLYKKESLAHLSGKHYLYDLFRGHQVAMELYLREIEQIPDILIDRTYAFELQLSTIPTELLINRSYGYRSIGMEVFWIVDEQKLDKSNGLRLTVFQRCMVDIHRKILISFCHTLKCCYIYQITGVNEYGNLSYIRSVFSQLSECLNQHVYRPEVIKIPKSIKDMYIKRCIAKRNVLEPTLSALYQMRIDWRDMPDCIGIILPTQIYIRTHPIEWQSQLMLLIMNETFEIDQFMRMLEFYLYKDPIESKREIVQQLISEYYSAVKEFYVQS